MQSFLCYSSFTETAKTLDYRRCGKMRCENFQLLTACIAKRTGNIYTKDKNGRTRKRGWLNHTALLMWYHPDGRYEMALKKYINAMIDEWVSRGYVNNMKKYKIVYSQLEYPEWLGDERVHSSHRAALLYKNYDYYSRFNWKEKPELNYYWPKNEY